MQFVERTARATTIVQREHRENVHNQLMEQQQRIHHMYQVWDCAVLCYDKSASAAQLFGILCLRQSTTATQRSPTRGLGAAKHGVDDRDVEGSGQQQPSDGLRNNQHSPSVHQLLGSANAEPTPHGTRGRSGRQKALT